MSRKKSQSLVTRALQRQSVVMQTLHFLSHNTPKYNLSMGTLRDRGHDAVKLLRQERVVLCSVSAPFQRLLDDDRHHGLLSSRVAANVNGAKLVLSRLDRHRLVDPLPASVVNKNEQAKSLHINRLYSTTRGGINVE